MAVDKRLLAGSTTMLVLKLLDGQDMYGYQMIEEPAAPSVRSHSRPARSIPCCTRSRIKRSSAPTKRMRAQRVRAAIIIWSARGSICCAKRKTNGRRSPLR